MMKESVCKQIFRNESGQIRFIFLEPSTSRYRLAPGDELILRYNPETPIEIEFSKDSTELIVWTNEMELFHVDGREAETNYEPAP